MKIMGKILITLVVILVIVYVVYFAGTQGWLKNTPLENFNYKQLNLLSPEGIEQTKTLTNRAKDTSEHVQYILGDKIEVDQERKDKQLHEKTIEYARYLYCKQVVDDWEKNTID